MPPLGNGLFGPAGSVVMAVHGRTGDRVGDLGGVHS